MARINSILLAAFLFSSFVLGQSGSNPDTSTIRLNLTNVEDDFSTPNTDMTTSSEETTKTSTTESSTTTLSTEKTTTMSAIDKHKTTSTTAKPTTSSTTAKPTTTTSTTAKPTTTTSTTAKPTTTTSTPAPPIPPPAPTPTPGPLPPPQQGTWSYKEANVTCVVVQFAAQLNVTYTIKETAKLAHALLNVPSNATVVGGSCGNTTQWIQLSWPEAVWSNNLTLQFNLNESRHEYYLVYFNATLTPDNNFPNISSNKSIVLWHATPVWNTPTRYSYRCSSPTQLNMTEESEDVATLTISMLQEEAFKKTSETGFSAARDCGGGDVPDAVPIAVGCALGGLVVVVLVAYLVGRRRSAAARGYLSM